LFNINESQFEGKKEPVPTAASLFSEKTDNVASVKKDDPSVAPAKDGLTAEEEEYADDYFDDDDEPQKEPEREKTARDVLGYGREDDSVMPSDDDDGDNEDDD